jgi:hypothetical protein
MSPEDHLDEMRKAIRMDITRELMAQISDKERQIYKLERLIESLTLDLAIAKGEIKIHGASNENTD